MWVHYIHLDLNVKPFFKKLMRGLYFSFNPLAMFFAYLYSKFRHKKHKQKNITFRMKNTKKKLNSQSKIVKASFTGSNITKYSGLNTVAKYMNRQNIVVGTVW